MGMDRTEEEQRLIDKARLGLSLGVGAQAALIGSMPGAYVGSPGLALGGAVTGGLAGYLAGRGPLGDRITDPGRDPEKAPGLALGALPTLHGLLYGNLLHNEGWGMPASGAAAGAGVLSSLGYTTALTAEKELAALRNEGKEASEKGRLKNPEGGLTAAGRRHYAKTEGANLKPGVKNVDKAGDSEKKRWARWAVRFYSNPRGPMTNDKGEPTRLALMANAWGTKVPKTREEAQAIAARGRKILESAKGSEKKSYYMGTQMALEELGVKTAASMAVLRAAARRIPGVTRVVKGNPALPAGMAQSLELHGAVPFGGMYVPRGPNVPAEWADRIFVQPGGRMGAEVAALRSLANPPPAKVKMMVDTGLITPEMAKSFPTNLPVPPYTARQLENSEAFTTLHEAMERNAVNAGRSAPPVGTHANLEVLLNDNNMLARASGPGSASFRKYHVKMRRDSGQAQGLEQLMRDTYGAPHAFGVDTITKAMRRDLMRKADQMTAKQQGRWFTGIDSGD